MSDKKVLIIGSNGLLAFDLIRAFKGDGKYGVIGSAHEDFDVADKEAVERSIMEIKPNIIINTAVFFPVDECEKNPRKSFEINTIGALNVAKAAKKTGAKVIFISTDYIFDGSKEYFTENDMPNSLNVYGASKLAGENLTKIANENHYIIRTSWLFGVHKSGKGNNFVALMLEKAKNGENIKVVDDQFGSPTYTHDLAFKIKELVDKNVPSGTYHITNSDFCSWYEFAEKIFELSNLKPNFERIKSEDGLSKIKRPKCSVLVSENLKKQDIESLRPWQDALGDFVLEYNRK